MASIVIDPTPYTLAAVTVTGITCYSDSGLSSQVTFPQAISTATRYYVVAGTPKKVTVSILVDGVEVLPIGVLGQHKCGCFFIA